jgi:GntR family transcriptional regulator
MFIEINPSSGLPTYLQIIKQIKYSIAAGALKSGDRVPPVRELATQLRINPNTVAKAYRELQHEKIIIARWGEGSFVTDQGTDDIGKKERVRIVSELLDNALVQAFHFNLADEELRNLLNQRLESLKKRSGVKSEGG